MTPVQLLLNFAKDLATNYDCQCDGDNGCRACKADAVIREVLGDKAESLLKGPYYGSAPHVVESLNVMGSPTDHLTFGEAIVTKEDGMQERIDELTAERDKLRGTLAFLDNRLVALPWDVAEAYVKAATDPQRWEQTTDEIKRGIIEHYLPQIDAIVNSLRADVGELLSVKEV